LNPFLNRWIQPSLSYSSSEIPSVSRLSKWPVLFRFPSQNFVNIYHLLHAWYMICPCRCSWFSDVRWLIQVSKPLIRPPLFSPLSCHFLLRASNTQYFVLKHCYSSKIQFYNLFSLRSISY
jgi:hypothetical protein